MRNLTGGSTAIMCPACCRGAMTAGPDGVRDPVPNMDAASKAVATTGFLDPRFDRSSSRSALSSRRQRAVSAASACPRVIAARAMWAIPMLNPGRSRGAVRSPAARQDRGHKSLAALRQGRCRAGSPAGLPARRRNRLQVHECCEGVVPAPGTAAMVGRARGADQRSVYCARRAVAGLTFGVRHGLLAD
jgi:hypothetical protein